MNSCDTCAFREGSVTHDTEPYNRFRGQIAALAGVPFFCHHGLIWQKPIATKHGMAIDVEGKTQRLRVCEGWRSQVAKEITPKTKNRMIRRVLGTLCLDTLEASVRETDPLEKSELWSELRRTFKQLLHASKLKIVRGGECVMKLTRPQLLWVFQQYLDKLQIADPERRERLSAMFLERKLSAHTERDFSQWRKTNKVTTQKFQMRTRSSRLWAFRSWLSERGISDVEDRERWERLYLSKTLSKEQGAAFHRWVEQREASR